MSKLLLLTKEAESNYNSNSSMFLYNYMIRDIKSDVIKVKGNVVDGSSSNHLTYSIFKNAWIFTRKSGIYVHSCNLLVDPLLLNNYKLAKLEDIEVLGLDGNFYYVHSVNNGEVVLSKYSNDVHKFLDFTSDSFKTVSTNGNFVEGQVVELLEDGTLRLGISELKSVHSVPSSDLYSDYYKVVEQPKEYPRILDILFLIIVCCIIKVLAPFLFGN